ncbi:hypothetical protein KR018_008553 [Drosophila ironensis]|nr:hypothetical protein KR018_008553 [Drosophila ironensis]
MFGEDVLRDFGLFMDGHDEVLNSLRGTRPAPLEATCRTSAIRMRPVIELTYSGYGPAEAAMEQTRLASNKPLSTLANLCQQCRDLNQRARQLRMAFVFCEFGDECSAAAVECTLHRMSASVEFFCQAHFLLDRIVAVIQNLWRQVFGVSSLPEAINEAQVFALFDLLTELLENFVVFSEITDRSKIADMWVLYKKWLSVLSGPESPSIEGSSSMELRGLGKSLTDIEPLLAGNIFRILLDALQELKVEQAKLKDVGNLSQHTNGYIRKQLLDIEANQSSSEYANFEEPKHVVRLTAFVATLHKLGLQLDGKLVKGVHELVARHQVLPLVQGIHWCPLTFLAQHAKSLFKTPARPQDVVQGCGPKAQPAVLEKFRANDARICRNLGSEIAVWSISMRRVIDRGIFGQMKIFSQLLLRGQRHADEINNLANTLINRYVALTTPLSKGDWFLVWRLLQYLQIIQDTFEANQVNFVRILDSLVQWQKQKVLHLLRSSKAKIVELKLLQRNAQLMSTLRHTEKTLAGFPSYKRITFANLAFGKLQEVDKLLPVEKHRLFSSILVRANNLVRYRHDTRQQMDAMVVTYNLWLLSSSILKEYVKQQRNPYSLQHIVAVSHQLDKSLLIFRECDPTKQSANDLMIEFLRVHLEFFVRVEALSHLFQYQDQPFQETVLDYRHCISSPATEFGGNYNIIRDNLENYLTATFYNLTTIAPHDWKSYEKMRHFAKKVLNLHPIEDQLPNQILDQGIDVLQIMRNIHTFASSYAYNMNLQLFVETESKGKHLDIIGTRHVANSVQTHGTGIINTTVNFIYQFLRQKFYTFSTFLHDEQIKSRLLKELRFHTENKHTDTYQSYPYERADNFLKKIKKLGCATNGETYMDLFRKVITQVGNAVGYVRLLQAGSKNANFRSRSYMCRVDSCFETGSFDEMQELTVESIGQYAKSLGHIKECYSDSTNYFRLLLQAFRSFLCNPHNQHLKTFYLITPAVITNYIEHRVREKLKVHKKDQTKFSLFEDGFAIGLVYILSMLSQLGDFHELGWQQTIRQHIQTERSKVRAKEVVEDPDEKLLQTVAITERHVNAYEHEYSLLYATLSSSEIFFQ